MSENFRKIAWTFTSINGFLAVLMGAAAAHWLENFLPLTEIKRIDKAATYQMYHTLAMLALLMANESKPYLKVKMPLLFFMLGITLFCISLYMYSFYHFKPLVYIVPFGGFSLMLGWLSLILVMKKV